MKRRTHAELQAESQVLSSFLLFFLKREQTAELEAKSLGTPDGQVTNNSRCSAINLLLEM